MKKKNFLIKSIVMVFALVVLGACSNDDDGGSNEVIDSNIVELAQANPNLTNLVSALQTAELVSTLQGNGPFTVFAPTDDAFAALLNVLGDDYNSIADFDTQAEIDLLTEILLYHVVPQQVLAADLAAGSVGTALSGNSIEIIASGGTFVIGDASDVDANITGTDILATNGVVHTIDKILLPQSAIDFVADLNATIVDRALATPDLSILVQALTAADLVSTLQGDGPFTVFAPTNAAFEQFLIDNNFPSLADVPVDVLTQVLLNHVVSGVNLSTGLSTGYVESLSTAGVDGNNLSMFINTDGGVEINGVSTVTNPDITAANGVVHIVDAVIGLPDVTTFAIADPTFSTLVSALTAYPNFTYVAALQTPNGTAPAPFTVFAPTNDAFGDLLTDLQVGGLGDIDEVTLASVLELHVVAGNNVRAEDLPGIDGASVETLGGQNIVVDANAPAITGPDTNANGIIATNVQATNGVIHAISRVIR